MWLLIHGDGRAVGGTASDPASALDAHAKVRIAVRLADGEGRVWDPP